MMNPFVVVVPERSFDVVVANCYRVLNFSEHDMPKTVLIVEDNAIHASLIEDVLGTRGFKTVHAARGGEALSLAREFRPDLVIMDIQLPDISGMEVTKTFKADDELSEIPIVAVTAFASKREEEMILQAGCAGFLTKPFSIPDLLETVAKFLS